MLAAVLFLTEAVFDHDFCDRMMLINALKYWHPLRRNLSWLFGTFTTHHDILCITNQLSGLIPVLDAFAVL